jgi:TnpA family transposase
MAESEGVSAQPPTKNPRTASLPGDILVCRHVDENYVVVHSQMLKASASEVAAMMVEGAVRHGT